MVAAFILVEQLHVAQGAGMLTVKRGVLPADEEEDTTAALYLVSNMSTTSRQYTTLLK